MSPRQRIDPIRPAAASGDGSVPHFDKYLLCTYPAGLEQRP